MGVILDGNRRFAEEWDLTERDAYRRGADKVDDLLEWCDALRIPQVTVWVLSIENLARPPEEIGPLLEIIGQKMRPLLPNSWITSS